jgi:hypothetical protein
LINLSALIVCPNCGSRVLPLPDRTCPSCQLSVDEIIEEDENGELPEERSEEQVEELTPEPVAIEELIDPGAVPETESADEYENYRLTAEQVNRDYGWTLGGYAAGALLGLAVAGYFAYHSNALGDPGKILPSLAIGLGIAIILIVTGTIHADRLVNNEVDDLLLRLPGFDLFYELFRPHWRNHLWKKTIDPILGELFQTIIRPK